MLAASGCWLSEGKHNSTQLVFMFFYFELFKCIGLIDKIPSQQIFPNISSLGDVQSGSLIPYQILGGKTTAVNDCMLSTVEDLWFSFHSLYLTTKY